MILRLHCSDILQLLRNLASASVFRAPEAPAGEVQRTAGEAPGPCWQVGPNENPAARVPCVCEWRLSKGGGS